MTIITGDPNVGFITSTEVPDGSMKARPSTIAVPCEALLHNTAYLEALRHPRTNIERWLRHVEPNRGVGTNYEWQISASDPAVHAGWKDTAHVADGVGASSIFFVLDCPHNATLKRIDALIRPSGAHSGMPVTRPKLLLARWTPAIVGGPALTALATFTDTSFTVSDYELPHFVGGDVNVTINHATSLYRFGFFSEAGNNSKNDLVLDGIRIRFDMTHLDEAAS